MTRQMARVRSAMRMAGYMSGIGWMTPNRAMGRKNGQMRHITRGVIRMGSSMGKGN